MISNKTGQSNAKSAVKAQIDENLRRAYAEVLTEAIPDRFTQLLEQLRTSGGAATMPEAAPALQSAPEDLRSATQTKPPAQTPQSAEDEDLCATEHSAAHLAQGADQHGEPPEGPK